MISSIQNYTRHPDGTLTLEGLPHVRVDAIQGQGAVVGRDIARELGLPIYFEDWEAMAKARGLSRRMVRFILADESRTRLEGCPNLQPRLISLPQSCGLEFGHHGFLVGAVCTFFLGYKEYWEDLKNIGVEVPSSVEGDCIIAQAQLFDSPLADKAWEALERGIFTHVCPLILRKDAEPMGTGQLVEVSLTTDDYPGCPGAKILRWWKP